MTERHYSSYDHIGVPIFVAARDMNSDFRYVYLNASFETASGCPRSMLLGKPLSVTIWPGKTKLDQSRLVRVLESGRHEILEHSMGVGQSKRYYRTTLKPVQGADQNHPHLVGTCIEIKAQSDTIATKTPALVQNPQNEQFVALAAHDLRAPMRNVRVLTEMLRDSATPPDLEQTHLLDLLDDVAAKSNDLIDDVLAHTQTVHAPSDKVAFDLGLMCRNLCDVLDPFGHHSITWPEAMIETDRLATQLALRNLLENAIKHGEKSSLSIQIELFSFIENRISLRVSDDGKGFDKSEMSFLETGVFRTGNGYGLMGVYRLLSERDGRLAVIDTKTLSGGSIEFNLPGRVLKVKITKRRARMHQIAAQIRRDAVGMLDKE